MAEKTNISWCDATQNFWIGCTEVSTEENGGGGCDNCYARELSERYGWAKWGAGEPRHRTSKANWGKPRTWDREAARTGYRPRVFCSSLSDVFDNEVPDQWRVDMWAVIRETPNLRWMLLTKRIGNAAKMLPPDWPFPHVGLMATLVNQMEWDRDYHKLAAIPAPWRGVSLEPLLGKIDMGSARPDLVIVGGESGKHRRPLDLDAVRSLRDQCARSGLAFHFKQHGALKPGGDGCDLDGREHKEFPPALAA